MGLFKWLCGSKKKPTSTQDTSKDEPKLDEHVKSAQDKNRMYHVSLNKDEKSDYYKKWRVRLEKSDKTIKYFDTQKQAIDFAEGLAKEYKTSVVIHKVDGSIRKQDYTT
ncbi:MAG: DUF2188 domain-containing protein [Bacillota bacterium]